MARVTLIPVTKAGAKGLTIPSSGAQSLSGFTGVQFVNNGQMTLLVYNGTGSQTITQNIGGQVQGIAPTVVPARADGQHQLRVRPVVGEGLHCSLTAPGCSTSTSAEPRPTSR